MCPVQTAYNEAMPEAFAGMIGDGVVRTVKTRLAKELIQFGLGLTQFDSDEDGCRLPIANAPTLLLDADLIASNVYTVVINGVSVAYTYSASHAASLTALAALIQALGFIKTAVAATRTITIVPEDDIDITSLTGVVTAGSSQAGVTVTFVTTDTLDFVALATQAIEQGARRLTVLDQSVITISGDALNTSDTVIVIVNGVTLSTVTYATSEAVTLQLVANEIMGADGVVSATVSGRTITVLNRPGLPLIINSVTIADNALASVAPSAAIVASAQDATHGLGDVYYAATEAVSAIRRGTVFVPVEEAVVQGDSVYVRFRANANGARGGFRNDADSGTCFDSGLKYDKGAAAGGFAKLDLNLP